MKMRSYILLAGFLISVIGQLNAQLIDNFDDGNFTSNPAWVGESSKFIINTNGQLQLNDVAASVGYLSAVPPTSIANTEWQFFIKQSFSPSGNNFGRVYLVSNEANLTNSLNGYFLQFGESGSSDAIELFRQDGTSEVSICRGSDGFISSSFEINIKVTRDDLGNWEVFTAPIGSVLFNMECTGTDNTYTSNDFFGVVCTYTSSNSTKFYFDNFYVGDIIVDTESPSIQSISVISDTEIVIAFSEPVNGSTAEDVLNYTVNNGIGNPISAVWNSDSPTQVQLLFSPAFTNTTSYTVSINGVEDISGNATTGVTGDFIYFQSDIPDYKDVVFNEIMADPTPPVNLPEAEFLELFNNSGKTFDLEGWQLSDGTSVATLSALMFAPGVLVTICSEDDLGLFSPSWNPLGASNFPSLNNSGDELFLYDENGNLVDKVAYSDTWYRDDEKENGGYTLELINPNLPCSGALNWSASNAELGGTPGQINSVFSMEGDSSSPVLNAVIVHSETLIEVVLSETLDSISVLSGTYTIDNGLTVSTIENNSPDYTSIFLTLSSPILEKVIYHLTLSNISDCSGNIIAEDNAVKFALPENAEIGDLIINEILFNPYTGGSDFVEVYNNSDKTIDLSFWEFANGEDDTISNHKIITENQFLLFPKEYIGFTENKNNVTNEYPLAAKNRLVEVTDLPTYNDSEGSVFLVSSQNSAIDQVQYKEEYHFSLLTDLNGVSLERIDFNRPSNDATNWHSAAENVGFATPGYKNSQAFSISSEMDFAVEPEIFSPDNDGYHDVVVYSYELDEPGYVGNITMFDSKGRYVKHLMKNELLNESGAISWDGINEKGEKSPIGIYIVYFEVFNLQGNVSKLKKTVVLGGKI